MTRNLLTDMKQRAGGGNILQFKPTLASEHSDIQVNLLVAGIIGVTSIIRILGQMQICIFLQFLFILNINI
jgi:hypothetical protein